MENPDCRSVYDKISNRAATPKATEPSQPPPRTAPFYRPIAPRCENGVSIVLIPHSKKEIAE